MSLNQLSYINIPTEAGYSCDWDQYCGYLRWRVCLTGLDCYTLYGQTGCDSSSYDMYRGQENINIAALGFGIVGAILLVIAAELERRKRTIYTKFLVLASGLCALIAVMVFRIASSGPDDFCMTSFEHSSYSLSWTMIINIVIAILCALLTSALTRRDVNSN